MCGIAGIYAFDGHADEAVVRAMTKVLRHRGPMDEGYLYDEKVALGMRRLSIIDIEGGHQPVFNEDGTVGVVFNGEIYNYVELREELRQKGHRFVTRSDTEVLVHLYEDLGEGFLTRLNGMFAIALWDARNRTLLLARDRLGIKPMYLYQDPRRLAFASELKALLHCPFVPLEPDRDAIAEYLTLMYIRAPRTPLNAVRKVLPGTYLVVAPHGTRAAPYWDLREHCEASSMSEQQIIEQLHYLLDDAVRLRLRSDVPVGAFVSGGIDSSSLVAFAARHAGRPVETFAVGFGGDGFNELGYARIVADAFATNHHETVVTEEDALRLLPMLLWHLDEPNGDSAMLPTYLVSRFAASHVRVMLSGIGGDELLGGYPRYFDGYPVEHLYRRLPQVLRRRVLAPAARLLPPHLAQRVAWNALGEQERYAVESSVLSTGEVAELLGGDPSAKIGLLEVSDLYPADDSINRLMFADMVTYLPDDILHLTDRMSMAVSLEARTPFLDYRLVEFLMGVPSRYKVSPIRRGWKIVLKKTMAPILPREIIEREKWGFGAPVRAWMTRRLLPVVAALYLESKAAEHGILVGPAAQRLLALIGTDLRRPRSAQKLWMLLVLEVWARVFLGAGGRQAPTFTLDDMGG